MVDEKMPIKWVFRHYRKDGKKLHPREKLQISMETDEAIHKIADALRKRMESENIYAQCPEPN